MSKIILDFGAYGFGLIVGGLVLLILLVLCIFRKARLSKRWAGFGMIGLGAGLSLTGISSAATCGIRLFNTLGQSGGGSPDRFESDMATIDQLFYYYQSLALGGIVVGTLILIFTSKPKR